MISRASLCVLLPAAFLAAQPPVRYDAGTISGLPVRNIGSAAMSGRVAAVTAINDSGRLTVFAASASGGVWKSVNGGTTFKPVFDSAAVQSMGAIAADPRNPKIVWAGTGESWVRNSV
ncbi:MAG TPA: sialidase, partial [Bryobacteraceae bacterium]